MRQRRKFVIIMVTFTLLMTIVSCNDGSKEVTINKDIVAMLEYLNLEECMITKLSLGSESDKKNMEAEEILKKIQRDSCYIFSEEQIIEYATNLGLTMTSDYILYQNIDLDEYLMEIYGISKTEFFEQCYQQAKNEVEYYLIIGAISDKEGITVSDKDVKAWCLSNGVEEEDLDEENLCYIKYYIIEEKIKLLLE